MPQRSRIGWLKKAIGRLRKVAETASWRLRDHPVERLSDYLGWCWLKWKLHRRRPQAFVLWHDREQRTPSQVYETSEPATHHFLFPDRLCYYFWIGGFAGAFVFLTKTSSQSATPCCLECFSCFDSASEYNYILYSVMPAVIIYIFVVYLMPYTIYVLWRIPVLEQLSMQLPDKFARWMLVGVTTSKGAKDLGRPRGLMTRLLLVVHWMTLFCCQRSRLAIAYDGLDSRQGRLTRLAMTEFFNPRNTLSEDSAVSRWIFYGLAPLWVFAVLMTLAIIVAALSSGAWVQKRELLLLDVSWVVLAWVFFVVETPRMSNDLDIKPNDLAFLPSQIMRPKTDFAGVITSRIFRLVLNAAVTIIAVVYATLSALVP